MNNILQKILIDCQRRLEQDKIVVPHGLLKEQIADLPPRVSFINALREKVIRKENAIIAEIKKKSPSQGVLTDEFNSQEIALDYQKNGASCISVLCERDWFGGDLSDLKKVREVSTIPLIRKDFITDIYQIDQSIFYGADCVLLILSILEEKQARLLEEHAILSGIDVLIEVHDEQELNLALNMKSHLLGINNRNLKTLEIDPDMTIKLSSKIGNNHDKIIISESGINSKLDIKRHNQEDIFAFLIGSSLMKSSAPGKTLKSLLTNNQT